MNSIGPDTGTDSGCFRGSDLDPFFLDSQIRLKIIIWPSPNCMHSKYGISFMYISLQSNALKRSDHLFFTVFH